MQVKIIVILFTRGFPYVQCHKNRLTCKKITLLIIKFSMTIG